MKSLHDVQKAFEKKVAENKAKEDAVRANPELAKTPEVKKYYRKHGLLFLSMGMIIGCAAYKIFLSTGTIYIVGPAMSTVLVMSGIWMIITGMNPFVRLMKY